MRSVIHFFVFTFLIFSSSAYSDSLRSEYQALIGEWANSDNDSQGITRVIFESTEDATLVRTFGKCQPVECELDVVPLETINGMPSVIDYEEPLFIMSLQPVLLAETVLQIKITKQLFDNKATIKEQVITLFKQ